MAAAIASDARATAASSEALCWASVWILVSSLPFGFSLEIPTSGGGRGVGVEGPEYSSRRFFGGGVKPDGEGMEASSSGEFGPVVEATGESSEKEFWVAIPGEATGVANDTFLCFFGILKHQKKGVEGRCG